MCLPCWQSRNSDRDPTRRFKDDSKWETCCWCGRMTTHGIYVKASNKLRHHVTHQDKLQGAY